MKLCNNEVIFRKLTVGDTIINLPVQDVYSPTVDEPYWDIFFKSGYRMVTSETVTIIYEPIKQ